MKNIFEKLITKILPFVLCICIVSGAVAPAYAATTNADTAAQKLFDLYWSTSSNPSGQNSTWYGVVRILLKDIYDRLESVWSDQRNLWTYNSTSYSLWNFSNNSNLSQSYYISNGAGPVSWLLNSMANLSQNTGYVANQFYNSNSNLNKAMSAMVSLNSNFQDYTSILNSIKSNTDNLSGIKTDTDNLSGIKTDTANLSGIKTDTANLSGIKTDTGNIYLDIHSNGSFTVPVLEKGNWSNSNPLINNVSSLSYPVWIKSYGRYRYRDANNGHLSTNDILQIINANSIFNNSITMTPYLTYDDYNIGNGNINLITYTDDTNTTMYRGLFSIADIIYRGLYNTNTALSKLQFVLADDATISAKRDNANNENAVLTNFTGSGSASATPSDFGAVKDSIVDFKAGFTGGASSSDTFSFMSGDSNAWDWFTQDTANDVDRTQGNNTRLLRSSSFVASDTPLLDSYYTSILSILGGNE